MNVRVKISAQQKNEGVKTLADGRLHVAVHAEKKQGKANERMRIVLATHFGVPVSSVRIISGQTLPTKTVSIKEG